MVSFAGSINNLINKFGRMAGLELSDWSSGYSSFKELSNVPLSTLVSKMGIIMKLEKHSERINILCGILFALDKEIELSEEAISQIFFSATRLFEEDSRRVKFLTTCLMCAISHLCTHTFMLHARINNDTLSNDEWVQANAYKMYVLISSETQEFDSRLRKGLMSNRNYVLQSLLSSLLKLANRSPSALQTIRRLQTQITAIVTNTNQHSPGVVTLALSLILSAYSNDTNFLLQILTKAQLSDPIVTTKILQLCRHIFYEGINDQLANQLVQFVLFNLAKDQFANEAIIQLQCCKILTDFIISAIKHETSLSIESLRTPTVLKSLFSLLSHEQTPVRYAAMCCISEITVHLPEVLKPFAHQIHRAISDESIFITVKAFLCLLLCEPKLAKRQILATIQMRINELSDSLRIELIEGLCSLGVIDSELISFLLLQIKDAPSQKICLKAGIELCRICDLNKDTSIENVNTCISVFAEIIEDCHSQLLLCYLIRFLLRYIPRQVSPYKNIMFILNRITLENNLERITSVHSCVLLASKVTACGQSIKTILEIYCLNDIDNELRQLADCSKVIIDNEKSLDNDRNKIDKLTMLLVENEIDQYLNEDKYNFDFEKIFVSAKGLVDSNSSNICDLENPLLYNGELHKLTTPNENDAVPDTLDLINEPESVNIILRDVLSGIHIGFAYYLKETPLTSKQDDLYVSFTIIQLWEKLDGIILKFDFTNQVPCVTFENLDLHFVVAHDFAYLIEHSTPTITIKSNETKSICTYLSCQDRNKLESYRQEVKYELNYLVKEENFKDTYSQTTELKPIDLTLSAVVRPENKVKFEPTIEVVKKSKLNTRFTSEAAVLHYIQKNLTLKYVSDHDTANLYYLSGVYCVTRSPFCGSIHIVNGSYGILMKCSIVAQSEQLAEFIATRIIGIVA